MPFKIICNASNLVVGAVLGQEIDKKSHVICFTSRTLNPAQINYTTIEKKLLVIVFAQDKFRSYVFDSSITVFTDHAALRYLMTKKE